MELENEEIEILMEREEGYTGAVTSVNGQTGDVILTTSDLENTSGYQTAEDVQEAIAGKQDKLTAGNNITIEDNVISATDTRYTAGNGINLNGTEFSADTTVLATQQNLSSEVTNRENADIALQAQIDGISASSDVVDIVGTYADLQNYDTSKLKDNDIIKVLQDSTQNNATTYYRWSTSTHTFTLIGQEGPYYTKASANDTFVPKTRTVNGKALSADITLGAADVSAVPSNAIKQTTGSSQTDIMSQDATTQALAGKQDTLTAGDAITIDGNNVISADIKPADFFTTTEDTLEGTGTVFSIDKTLATAPLDMQLDGDTIQQTVPAPNPDYPQTIQTVTGQQDISATGKNLFNKDATLSNYYLDGSGTWVDGGTLGYVNQTYGINSQTTFAISVAGSYGNPYIRVGEFDDKGTFIKRTLVTTSGTLQTDANTRMVIFSTDNSSTRYFTSLQIEIGDSATTYEQFMGGNYTIDLGSIELHKIGNYQDYIYKSGNDWYVHKQLGSVTFDGTENWNLSTNNVMILARTAIGAKGGTADIKSDIATANANYGTNDNECYIGNSNVIFSHMVVNGTMLTQVSDWTTYLTNNHSKFVFPLATETDTQITDATLVTQLNALADGQLADGKTDFSVSASDLAAILEVKAYRKSLAGLVAKINSL